MPKFIDIEIAKDRLFGKHGGKIQILEYIGINSVGKFECKICGNIWESSVKEILGNETGCPKCYKEIRGIYRRRDLNYIKDFIFSQGCEWVGGEYKTCKDKIEIKFPCEHIGKSTFDNFKHGSRCRICGQIQGNKTRTNPPEEIISNIESLGYTFIDFPNGYTGCHSIIKYSCYLGHINEKEYILFITRPSCKKCKESKGERKIREYLMQNNVQYIFQYKIKECKYVVELPFDFYIPSCNLCIEYQGEQHFRPVDFFGGIAAYEELKIKDEIKRKYCEDNSINFLAIGYYDYDNIETILSKILYYKGRKEEWKLKPN